MKDLLLLLFCTLLSIGQALAQSVVGSWSGQLDIEGQQMNLGIDVSQEDGQFKSTLDIPAQGAMGIPIDNTSFENNVFSFTLSSAGISYTGTFDGNRIKGELSQSGMIFPLVFERIEKKLPGDISLPTSDADLMALAAFDQGTYQYQVEDYFKKPLASSFMLSPDGKYLSYLEKDEKGKRHLYIKEIATGKVKMALEEKENLIRTYFWINETRIGYMMDNGGDENYHIYAVNIDGSNNIDLTPYDGVRASILKLLKEQKDFVIISMNKEDKAVFEPYRVNVNSGEWVRLFENKDVENPIMGYDFDKDGKLRAYTQTYEGVNSRLYYFNDETKGFDLVVECNWSDVFTIVSFNYSTPYAHDAYVMTNLEGDKIKLVLYDLKTKKTLKEVYSNKDYDVDDFGISRLRKYEIDYFAYEGEKQVIVPVSKFYKKMYQHVSKAFPGKNYQVADYTDDESKFLLVIGSDKLYGQYYEYNSKTGKLKLLYDLMPNLKEADMAEMRPISFTSRDGLTIHGYITLPKEALAGKKVPMIVNPHGGPQGIRDSWNFNPESQLFASRGYATLHVNFRISGGYGKQFYTSGFKQIGRKAMDDVEDGVKYAISQGWIDADKIAIYGASHGGYATLMGMIKTPSLYACGIDYVGVSNIETFFSSFPSYWKPYLQVMKDIWYDLDNPEELEIARSVSPVNHIDKIKKPLFVVQGANDPRVNIAESDQIVSALRAKGFETPYMVKYNEGHGFGHEENNIQLYKVMLGFLAKHLK